MYTPVDSVGYSPDRRNLANYSMLTGESLTVAATDNPEFAWPGNVIRQIDGRTSLLQRGFMRSILTDRDVQAKIAPNTNALTRRLWFQFNPDFIERAVQQQIGSMNPLLQSPSNLISPVPGTSTFGFTLQFNREMEIARGKSKDLYLAENTSLESLQNLGPEKIGVMADLLIFDNIIGQGISSDLVELLSSYLNMQTNFKIDAETNAGQSNDATTDRTSTPADATEEAKSSTKTVSVTKPFDTETFKKQANLIFGNSAFLNPLPVRVVFSDLFMIEGLITATNVGFQKFSEKMIPTVCQINVSMEALYFGFAKKKAYLTQQLTEWSNQVAQDRQEQENELNKYSSINTKAPKTLVYALSNERLYTAASGGASANTSFNAMCNKILNLPAQQKDTNSQLTFKLYYTLSGNANVLEQNALKLTTPNVYLYYNGTKIPTHLGEVSVDQINVKNGTFYLNASVDVLWYAGAFGSGLSALTGSNDVKIDIDVQTYVEFTDTVSGQKQLTDKSDIYRVSFNFKSDDGTAFINAPQGSNPIKNMTTAPTTNTALITNKKNQYLNGLYYQK